MNTPPTVFTELLSAIEVDPDLDAEAFLVHHPAQREACLERLAKLRGAGLLPAPQKEPEPKAGDTLFGGRYRLVEVVGQGGMGCVWNAWDNSLERSVALKIALGRGAKQPDSDRYTVDLARFLREAMITGQLEHPGIVPVHSLGVSEQGWTCFAMRLVHGETLADVAARIHAQDRGALERFPVRHVVGMLVRVCDALGYAHAKGVLHRDLKPSNIMVGEFGEVQLMDWGLARAVGSQLPPRDASSTSLAHAEVTASGELFGTPGYMAPEQASGTARCAGPEVDVFGLGAILYHLLVGHAPYRGKSLEEVLARAMARDLGDGLEVTSGRVSRELRAVCLRAMAVRPEDRYATIAELRADLEAFLELRKGRAWRDPSWVRVFKAARRHKALATGSVAAVALSLALLFGWTQSRSVHAAGVREHLSRIANMRRSDVPLAPTSFPPITSELMNMVRLDSFRESWEPRPANASGYQIELDPHALAAGIDDAFGSVGGYDLRSSDGRAELAADLSHADRDTARRLLDDVYAWVAAEYQVHGRVEPQGIIRWLSQMETEPGFLAVVDAFESACDGNAVPMQELVGRAPEAGEGFALASLARAIAVPLPDEFWNGLARHADSYGDYVLLAGDAFRSGRFQDALAFAERAYALSPQATPALVLSSRAWLQLGHPTTALDRANELIACAPDSGVAWHALGAVEQQIGIGEGEGAALDRALAAYRRASELGAGPAPYMNAARIYLERADKIQAVRQLQACLRAHPGDRQIALSAAAMSSRLGYKQSATRVLRTALENDPDWGRGWAEVGRIFESVNLMEHAIPCYRASLENLSEEEIDELGYDPKFRIAKILHSLPEVLGLRDPEDALAAAYVATKAYLRKDYRRALQLLEEAMEGIEEAETKYDSSWLELTNHDPWLECIMAARAATQVARSEGFTHVPGKAIVGDAEAPRLESIEGFGELDYIDQEERPPLAAPLEERAECAEKAREYVFAALDLMRADEEQPTASPEIKRSFIDNVTGDPLLTSTFDGPDPSGEHESLREAFLLFRAELEAK